MNDEFKLPETVKKPEKEKNHFWILLIMLLSGNYVSGPFIMEYVTPANKSEATFWGAASYFYRYVNSDKYTLTAKDFKSKIKVRTKKIKRSEKNHDS